MHKSVASPKPTRSLRRTPPRPPAGTTVDAPQEHLQYHRDGSLWARGLMAGEQPTGYWEWYRKDGTRLRSGWFEQGRQTGEWTTYDRNGAVYKVTRMKAPAAGAPSAPPTPGRSAGSPRPAKRAPASRTP